MKTIWNIWQVKRGRLFFIVLLSGLCSFFSAVSQESPQLENYSLKNGLKVYLISYGKLEAVNISLIINSGIKNEIPGQQGYNEMVAELVLTGNKKYSREEQNKKAYTLGGSLTSNAETDYTRFSVNCLSKDAGELFDLLSAAIKEPLFEKEAVDQYLAYIQNYNTPTKMDISQLTQIYSAMVVHGTENPLGRNVYKEQLKQVTVEKIKTFHQFNYTPGNTRIVVAGKFNKEEVKKQIETFFGNWQSLYGEVNGVELEQPVIKKKEIYFVNRSGASQCALHWTKIAPSVKHKDHLAFEIANYLFNNVLYEEIREKGGKTYRINCTYSLSKFANLLEVDCSVRSNELLNTIKLFDSTLADFSKAGISEVDFKNEIMQYRAQLNSMEYPNEVSAFYNPLVYDFNSRKDILPALEKLSIEDVRKVIRKYFVPGIYKLVISGDEAMVAKQLSDIPGLTKLGPSDLVEKK